ncbi:MAG: HAD family hydrolase [Candidatus Acidiferrales bacterium]
MKAPQILIFDVDGVLVDVRRSFHSTILATVEHFTGRCVRRSEIQHWKSRSGFNDDWDLTYAWVRRLGSRTSLAEVQRVFNRFYRGRNGDGFVARESWMLPRAALARLARRYELALFTGRTWRELRHTLERFGTHGYFGQIVTRESVSRLKPDPEGLLRILGGRHAVQALYLGDAVDDALAARGAGVPFLGVLPRGTLARRLRGRKLRRLGALRLLNHVREVEQWLE